jgi:hypothetical protein
MQIPLRSICTDYLQRSATNTQNMKRKKYEIVWQIRYCFPIIFIILFAVTIYKQDWSIFNLSRVYYIENVAFIGELVVLFFALNFLFVRYEIDNDHLVVYRFFIIKRAYNIKKIQWIEEDGIYSFLGKIPLGIDLTVLNLQNGKRIRIIGLKEPLKFIQDIRSQLSIQNL